MSHIFQSESRFRAAQRLARNADRPLTRKDKDGQRWIHWLPGMLGGWTQSRDLAGTPQANLPRMVGAAQPHRQSERPECPPIAPPPRAPRSSPPSAPRTAAPPTAALAASDYAQIPRTYTQHSSLSREEIIALFTDRLIDYNAHVVPCTADQIPSAIQAALAQRESATHPRPCRSPLRISCPTGLDITADHNLSPAELDRFDATITLCTLAIAETGTLVLQGLAGQGRRAATLVPDVHICILPPTTSSPPFPKLSRASRRLPLSR